jgi:cbb3-type cytochrome oxidase cytochrome c subunit
MKGIKALFLGIFGTFAFSWTGLMLIPNFQIGHLDPQVSQDDENDVYPVPKSGMADRGRKIYAANGCVYCHSQQVRADYAASDIDRKWGMRRSAPRDYIFERPAMLGKMRLGPDLSNVGKRAPSEDASPSPSVSPAASPAANAATSPATSPAASASASPTKPVAATSPAPATAATAAAPSPSASAAATTATTAAAPSPSASPAATAATTTADTAVSSTGMPAQYSAAWHHLHLYSPRSVLAGSTSNMPAYKFLYEKRRVSGERSADALKLSGAEALPDDWEVVPSYDAKCLVAYLMSLDQSHALTEAKLISAPASSAAPASSPAPATAPAASPAPAKEEKK